MRSEIAARGRAMAIAALLVPALAAATESSSRSLENLQAAHAADVRARARYVAYAQRADEEGYVDVAALLRAAAHAEGVRVRSYAEVIRRLGAEPRASSPEKPRVAATRANLLSILGQENAERVTVYPRLVEQARRDEVPEAVLAFTLSHHAEESLVRLYQDAVARARPTRRGGDEFHVCETCGHVVRGPPPERCPVSLSPRAAFTRVH